MNDRLFPVPEKRKVVKPVRVLRPNARLYEVTFGLQKEYLYAADTDQALTHWCYKHPALVADDANVREFPQEELDELATTDPRLFRSIRSA